MENIIHGVTPPLHESIPQSTALEISEYTDPAQNAITVNDVDTTNAVIIITTTTANNHILPTPTEATTARTFIVINKSTSTDTFLVNSTPVQPSEIVTFVWDKLGWIPQEYKFLHDSNISTTWISGGELSINADPTKFDVAEGMGIVADSYTDPTKPTIKLVHFGPNIGVTVDGLATQPFTRIFIDADGSINQKFLYSREEARDCFLLGELGHEAGTSISLVTLFTATPTLDHANSIFDLATAIGDVNLNGNLFTSNGANLALDKTIGESFTLGFNAMANRKDPSTISHAALTNATFAYLWRDGSGGYNIVGGKTAIEPAVYDDGTGGAVVPNGTVTTNSWTTHRIWLGTANQVLIHYGQNSYNSLATAQANLSPVDLDTHNGLTDVLFRGWVIVRGGALDLSNPADANFIAANKFGF